MATISTKPNAEVKGESENKEAPAQEGKALRLAWEGLVDTCLPQSNL